MNKNDDIKIPSPESLGIPSGSFDPMKTIQMEGDLYRGLVCRTKSRSLSLRICVIFFAIIFFIMPGVFSLFLIFFKSVLGVEIVLTISAILYASLYTILFIELSQASYLFIFEVVWVFYALLSLIIGIEIIWKNIFKRD
jgi:hypothetical protein